MTLEEAVQASGVPATVTAATTRDDNRSVIVAEEPSKVNYAHIVESIEKNGYRATMPLGGKAGIIASPKVPDDTKGDLPPPETITKR